MNTRDAVAQGVAWAEKRKQWVTEAVTNIESSFLVQGERGSGKSWVMQQIKATLKTNWKNSIQCFETVLTDKHFARDLTDVFCPWELTLRSIHDISEKSILQPSPPSELFPEFAELSSQAEPRKPPQRMLLWLIDNFENLEEAKGNKSLNSAAFGISRAQAFQLFDAFVKEWAWRNVIILMSCRKGWLPFAEPTRVPSVLSITLRDVLEEDRINALQSIIARPGYPQLYDFVQAHGMASLTGPHQNLKDLENNLNMLEVVFQAQIEKGNGADNLQLCAQRITHTSLVQASTRWIVCSPPYQSLSMNPVEPLSEGDSSQFARGLEGQVGREAELKDIEKLFVPSVPSPRPVGVTICGEGSSHFARCAVEQTGRPYAVVSGADIFKTRLGESEKVVAHLANLVARAPDLVLIFEHMDSWFLSRSSDDAGNWSLTKSVKDLFSLLESEAWEHHHVSVQTIILATLSAPNTLPSILSLPHHFGTHITLEPLSLKLSKSPSLVFDFLRLYSRGRTDELDLLSGTAHTLSQSTRPLHPAKLVLLVQEASIKAINRAAADGHPPQLKACDFDEASKTLISFAVEN